MAESLSLETQIVLGEIRAVRRDLAEVSLALRVDTFWTRVRDHLAYALRTLELVPIGARLLLAAGVAVAGFGLCYRQPKAVSVGADLFFLALMFVGSTDG